MTAKKLKTVNVAKNDYKIFLEKAKDFYEVMLDGEANTFKRIIVKKNLITYECREFRQAEAMNILKLAERFYRWITSKLPAL